MLQSFGALLYMRSEWVWLWGTMDKKWPCQKHGQRGSPSYREDLETRTRQWRSGEDTAVPFAWPPGCSESKYSTHLVGHTCYLLGVHSLLIIAPDPLCPFHCLRIWLSEEKYKWFWFCSHLSCFFYWSIVDSQDYVSFRCLQHSDWTSPYVRHCSPKV